MLHQVVEDVSSCLGDPSLKLTQHIGSNHMDMCRFGGLHDVEYRKVVAALERVQNITEGSANVVLPGSYTAFIALTRLPNSVRHELST